MASLGAAGTGPARMAHEQRLETPDRANDATRAAEGTFSSATHQDALRRAHPELETALDDLRAGRSDRRGFLRIAGLLGASVGVAGFVAADLLRGGRATRAEPAPGVDAPRRGGRLTCAMPIDPIQDPARFEWVAQSNLLRHQNEHLTFTGADNVTRPMLAESWAASDDLTTWTFQLRENAYWRSGAAFTAEDVKFNFARWLDPALGSPNRALFAALSGPEAVEVVDERTVRLNFEQPVLSVAESLYNYPTAMMPRDFEGDISAVLTAGGRIDGTGPYELVEVAPGERALLKRAALKQPYWGAKVDYIGPGWLDEIAYVHFESADAGLVDAVLSGKASMTYDLDVDQIAQGALGGARVHSVDSAHTGCIRMRTDLAPFKDPRVRRAIQLCANPAAFPERVFRGRGRPGEHHHVAPIHPDYAPLRRPRRDIAAAKKLLAEAGASDGLDVTLQVGGTSGAWEFRAASLFAEQVRDAGVRIKIDRLSAENYRRVWKTTPFGLTQWSHRPLGTMALALAYRSGAAWNETVYSNGAFDAALAKAEALINIRARRRAMRPVQTLLQQDAPIVQPVWVPTLSLAASNLRGVSAQPTRYHHFNNVWIAA